MISNGVMDYRTSVEETPHCVAITARRGSQKHLRKDVERVVANPILELQHDLKSYITAQRAFDHEVRWSSQLTTPRRPSNYTNESPTMDVNKTLKALTIRVLQSSERLTNSQSQNQSGYLSSATITTTRTL
jgi:hypothetical protein